MLNIISKPVLINRSNLILEISPSKFEFLLLGLVFVFHLYPKVVFHLLAVCVLLSEFSDLDLQFFALGQGLAAFSHPGL
jgi:hypothetical protein